MTSEQLRKLGFNAEMIADFEEMENKIFDLEEELEELKWKYEELKNRRENENYSYRQREARKIESWEESTKYW